MSSIQSGAANLFARTVRNSFFIHKAETATQRASFERVARLAKFPRSVNMEQGALGGRPALWFVPEEIVANDIVLYLHGGGYCVGSPHTHKALIARIARAAGCRAVGIDYRLAPEHPFPAALEDCEAAYAELLTQDFSRIFLAGDSAGGGLAVALAMRLRDQGHDLPAALALLSPWVDLRMQGESIQTKANVDPLIDPAILESFAKRYYGDADPADPFISPVYGNLGGLPPVLIQVGGNEVLQDDATRLAKRMSKAGSTVELEIWDRMFHVWQYLGGLVPEAGKAIGRIGEFFTAHRGQAHDEKAGAAPPSGQDSAPQSGRA